MPIEAHGPDRHRGGTGNGHLPHKGTKNQIRRWASVRKVPYEPAPVDPTSNRFWNAVSEILSTCVRLDPPRAMARMDDPDAGIEFLFEAVVQPIRAPEITQTPSE